MNEMGSWALRDGADFLSTNAAESMNAVVKRHTKGKIFRPDVLVVKFHHLSERYFKEIVRGRYDEGDFVLAGNQRNNFQETDEKPALPLLGPSNTFLKISMKSSRKYVSIPWS